MNPEKIKESVNKGCKNFFDKRFELTKCETPNNRRLYVIKGTSWAVNRFDIPQESVQVLNWFDDFWLYLEIKFSTNTETIRKNVKTFDIHISLSVFQGEDNDNEKYQLFRAEWADYNNPDEKRAQPHWHITSSQAIENTFYKYANSFVRDDFIQLLENEKQKVFDVKKIHFAMNGNWANNNMYIHKITDEQQVAKWLQGVLSHLRYELGSK
ncbi:MAG: hypothetical protein LBC68_09050 [Prevotellaceae bacterium]|jgi:hypothetical protein|nr:hypothetical protein [Prevotellaceae bacterium]